MNAKLKNFIKISCRF